MVRVREIIHDTGVWLSTAAVREFSWEIDGAVKVETTIVVDVDVEGLERAGGIDQSNLTSLDEVVCHNEMLLVWCHFDVVWTEGWLIFIRVIKTLDVVEIGQVQGRDMVGGGKGEVSEASVSSNIGALLMKGLITSVHIGKGCQRMMG